ncbi:hypothetical protein BH09SUM1_BH09SUM1_18620 [soil metagenome]
MIADPGWKLAAAACVFIPFAGLFCAGIADMRLQLFCRAIWRGSRARREVALSFDDGPDPETTPALLDLLAEENVRAVFFCIGDRVEAHPEIARRIVREGHLIANHTQRHSYLTNFLGARGLDSEISDAQRAIYDATGLSPRFFRSPVGLTNPHFAKVLRAQRVLLIGWDFRALDRGRSAEAIARRVLRRTKPGSIIVLHDGGAPRENLLRAVRLVMEGLRKRRFRMVRLDRLMRHHAYRE